VRALDDYMWMLFEVVDVVMMLERVVWPRNFLMYCDHVVYWADFGWQIPASCPLVRVEWHRSLSELSSPALCVWPEGLSLYDSSLLGSASGPFLPPLLSALASFFHTSAFAMMCCTYLHNWLLFVFSLCVVCGDCVMCCGWPSKFNWYMNRLLLLALILPPPVTDPICNSTNPKLLCCLSTFMSSQ